MGERVWDRFLTEQDRAHVAANPARPWGFGQRPALLLVDLYRWVFGDEPAPLLESTRNWPGSCGLAGWQALPHIRRLLGIAREVGIPVIHITGLDNVQGWAQRSPEGAGATPEQRDRRRRRYQIVDEVAPIEGEVVLGKVSPSAFWGTPLVGLLTDMRVDTLVVAGESTSGCVRATVVDGRTNRFRMIVVEECVFDRHQATHAINLFDMEQKYADVLSLDDVASSLRAFSRVTTAV